ncbi:hypothetical protein EDD86DRAFT_276016 [Gorgonomyces haynaldii]|nr:hypothetical protein EDD86DRAFT_276016 [Gorgonomyces haynaldii]
MTDNKTFYVIYQENQSVAVETHFTPDGGDRKRPLSTVGQLIAAFKEAVKPDLDQVSVQKLTLHPAEDADALDEFGEEPTLIIKSTLNRRTSSTGSNQSQPAPHPHRLQRWESLNRVLGTKRNKKARRDCEGHSLSYSSVTWKSVEEIFEGELEKYEQDVLPIPEPDFQLLLTMLSWIFKCYKSTLLIGLDSEAKRIHLIAPVLWAVVQLLPDVTVNVEAELKGKRVDTHGHFEFILTRGSKRVCIVEAKKEDFHQGMAQDLLGCEVAADLDSSSEVYGIVTNFEKWIFLKSQDERILADERSVIRSDRDRPKEEDLREVVGKLHSLLA